MYAKTGKFIFVGDNFNVSFKQASWFLVLVPFITFSRQPPFSFEIPHDLVFTLPYWSWCPVSVNGLIVRWKQQMVYTGSHAASPIFSWQNYFTEQMTAVSPMATSKMQRELVEKWSKNNGNAATRSTFASCNMMRKNCTAEFWTLYARGQFPWIKFCLA